MFIRCKKRMGKSFHLYLVILLLIINITFRIHPFIWYKLPKMVSSKKKCLFILFHFMPLILIVMTEFNLFRLSKKIYKKIHEKNPVVAIVFLSQIKIIDLLLTPRNSIKFYWETRKNYKFFRTYLTVVLPYGKIDGATFYLGDIHE